VVGIATGVVWFAIAAQAINGFTYACDSVGRGTLMRRSSTKQNIGEAFGYFDTVANFGWLIAAFIGAAVVSYVPLPLMFFAITPTSLIALFLIYRMPVDHEGYMPSVGHRSVSQSLAKGYARFIYAIRHWGSQMRRWGASVIATSALNVISDFILPIYAFGTGASLPMVMILAALANIPSLFGSRFGWLVDKYPVRVRNATFFISAVLIGTLAVFPEYYWQLAVAFLLGIAVELLSLVNATTGTRLSNDSIYGVVTSELEFFSGVSAVAAPLAFGGLIDAIGSVASFSIIGFGFIVLVVYLHRQR